MKALTIYIVTEVVVLKDWKLKYIVDCYYATISDTVWS